jgi:hypothetical protein
MKTMRSLEVAAVGLLLLGLSQGALAQQPAVPPADPAKTEAVEEIRLVRVGLAAMRQTLITEGMDLMPDEMQAFWPLYRDYRLEAIDLGDRIVELILRYADNYDQMTDEAADKLLADFVSIEQARTALKAKYLPKFKQILPARKVARFYQLENKLDTAVFAELAEVIPLVR